MAMPVHPAMPAGLKRCPERAGPVPHRCRLAIFRHVRSTSRRQLCRSGYQHYIIVRMVSDRKHISVLRQKLSCARTGNQV